MQTAPTTLPANAGMEDLWAVYEAHYADLGEIALSAVDAVPELYDVVKSLQARHEAGQAENRSEQTRRALKVAMLSGEWDAYINDVRDTGAAYAQAGLGFSVWSVVFSSFRQTFMRYLRDAYGNDLDRLSGAMHALAVFTDKSIGAIGDEYLRVREEVIQRQQEAIRELSTPVLKVRSGLLVLPLIGLIDGERARGFTARLLASIRSERARVVIIDLTGVPAVDSAVANHLVMAAKAARLLGATAIITGLSTVNATTLAKLGVDLGEVLTVADLEIGIEEASHLLHAAAVN